jgi:hypothetical protein
MINFFIVVMRNEGGKLNYLRKHNKCFMTVGIYVNVLASYRFLSLPMLELPTFFSFLFCGNIFELVNQ